LLIDFFKQREFEKNVLEMSDVHDIIYPRLKLEPQQKEIFKIYPTL